jgi:drug/metabolite transporter (DMT)-like permease
VDRAPCRGRCPLVVRQAEYQLRSHRLAVLLALLVTVLWSSSWILIRWGLDDEGLSPLMFAALRYGLAAIVLAGFVIVRERHGRNRYHVDRGFVTRLVLLGVVMYALTQGAMFVALDEQPAATTSLVLSMTPLFVAGLAAVTLAELPSRWQLTGVVMVAVGAALYFAGDLGATFAGMAAALLALGANVVAAVLGRSVNRAGVLPALTITTVSMAIGAGVLVFTAVGYEGIPAVTGRGWLIIFWLAVVNTAFAFTLWNLSLQRLSAVESASINNTMLVQIALLAWVFLGEAPGAVALLGIALVTVGVYIVQSTRWVRIARTGAATNMDARVARAADVEGDEVSPG